MKAERGQKTLYKKAPISMVYMIELVKKNRMRPQVMIE